MADRRLRLAVLIDGDNVSPDAMNGLFMKIADIGDPIIRTVYGGKNAVSKRWIETASRHAMAFGRRHLHATGHNATDIEMVIGAMDLLGQRAVDGFCLVSSDADFTPLAIHLREAGMMVYGCGSSASASFRAACHQFIPMDISFKPAPVANVVAFPSSGLEQAVAAIRRVVEKHAAGDGWVLLSTLGIALSNEIPASGSINTAPRRSKNSPSRPVVSS